MQIYITSNNLHLREGKSEFSIYPAVNASVNVIELCEKGTYVETPCYDANTNVTFTQSIDQPNLCVVTMRLFTCYCGESASKRYSSC